MSRKRKRVYYDDHIGDLRIRNSSKTPRRIGEPTPKDLQHYFLMRLARIIGLRGSILKEMERGGVV
jgi:hypothetical protein